MAGITIPLITEFKDKGIKQAMKEFKALETTGKKAQFALKKAALPAIMALGALAVAAGKAIAAGEAVSTANSRILQINESMGLFGSSTKIVTDRLIKLAEKTAMQTGMDNLAIKATQAKLLTFKNLAETADEVGGAFDRATAAAIDLAAAGFGTAESNAVQLGKALEDPIKGIAALAKSGVTFTKAEKKKIEVLVESGKLLEAQEIILKALEKQVGGTARATANSTDIMKEGFAQFQQQLGLALLPVLEKVTPLLLKIAEWAKNNPGVFLAIAAAVGVLAVSILAVNVAMMLNPAILITAAIVALGVAIFAAYKKFETFRNIVDSVFNFIKNNWPLLLAILTGPFGLAVYAIIKFKDSIIGILLGIKKVAVTIFDGIIGAYKSVMNSVLGLMESGINKAISGLNMALDAVDKAAGPLVNFGEIPDISIPRLADGGIVTAPTLAMIGEKGPEAVIPLTGRNAGVGGTNYVTINVSGADPNAVVQALQKYVRQSGPVPVNIRNM